MADNRRRERTNIVNEYDVKIFFPLRGLSRVGAYEDQPPLTSPHCMNVRLVDVKENRARGGQRPGLKKAYDTQIVGDHPVIKMLSITHTYMESS